MFKIVVFFIVCYILSSDIGLSQEPDLVNIPPELKKNVISATFGSWPQEFYFSFLGNYERMLVKLPKSCVHSFWIRAGAGPWAAWGPTGVNCVSTISALIGRGAAHFEFGSGVLFTYWSDEKEFHPVVNERYLAGFSGFRYQKPGGAFAFRTGLGWPDGIYLSFGYCF